MKKTDYQGVPTAPPDDAVVASVVVVDEQHPTPSAPVAGAYVHQSTTTSSNTYTQRSNNAYSAALDDSSPLGRRPIQMALCPKCAQAHVRTRTKTYPSLATWIFVGIGTVICFPLCWLPLVIDPLKQTDHYCQQCGQQVGSVRPLEDCCIKEMR